MTKKLNLFATVLTYAAPSSNYRGESEENLTVLQKITKKDGKNHTIISPESMRNALRDMLAIEGLPCNRSRLHDEGQPAVEFIELPNPEKYIDDFFFGYLVANTAFATEMKNLGRKSKRDSIVRVNLAVSVSPYKNNSIFHQSPLHGGKSTWSNDDSSNLLYREIIHTAYQYPFALAGQDCQAQPEWTKVLLKSIGQLTNVAGGHARSFYEMSPKSIVVRLTPSLIAGFDTYGFGVDENFSELNRINENDLPGNEFWIGGDLARNMDATEKKRLIDLGVHFYDNPQTLLSEVSEMFLPKT